MALVHRHEPNRGRDFALVGLALIIFAIIAAAVPISKMCIDSVFGLF